MEKQIIDIIEKRGVNTLQLPFILREINLNLPLLFLLYNIYVSYGYGFEHPRNKMQ